MLILGGIVVSELKGSAAELAEEVGSIPGAESKVEIS
jgi:hypothetical protein